MAELSAVTVGRANQLIADRSNLRRREVRARQEIEQNNQAQEARKNQALGKQATASRRRTQSVDDRQRARQASEDRLEVLREADDVKASDRRAEFVRDRISGNFLRRQALETNADEFEPLPRGEAAGRVLIGEETEIRDRLNTFADPIVGPLPDEDGQVSQGSERQEADAAAAPNIREEQRLEDALQGLVDEEITDQIFFDVLEGERAVRLTDRRQDDRDFLARQQINQEVSEVRIEEILFNPNLPRGSIVDVTG